MTLRSKVLMLTRAAFLVLVALGSDALADVVSINQAAFPPSSTLINFNGLIDGTEVNGLSVGGVSFAYSLGNGDVVIDGGPGVTNNINPPNIVSIGDNSGTLTITLPASVDVFGYGYALLSGVPTTNATTIAIFNGAVPLGSLSYNGVPDPAFTGGFAGIQSTISFNRVQVTFNSTTASAFALDNIRYGNTNVIPEPTTMLLLGTGLAGISAAVRKRRLRKE